MYLNIQIDLYYHNIDYFGMSNLLINKVEVNCRTFDGYIDATNLCKAGNKKFKHWHELKRAKQFLTNLSVILKRPIFELVIVGHGNHAKNSHESTWVHPTVATEIAHWISSHFAAKIVLWIEEWKTINTNNQKLYFTELNNIKISDCDHVERNIKLRLAAELKGACEVETPVGCIDILTSTELIEIKRMSKWLHAIGQIQGYYEFVSNKSVSKRIHLFYFDESELDKLSLIEQVCLKHKITVTTERVSTSTTI